MTLPVSKIITGGQLKLIRVLLTNTLPILVGLIMMVGTTVAQNATSIPSPRPVSWIVDQTNTLSEYQKDLIDKLCDDVKLRSRHELGIAIVKTTGGKFSRQYATDLFNHWGVGSRKEKKGILVFAAIGDRKAEIILGDGIDNAQTRRLAQTIMDDVIIPNMKKGDAGSAIYEAAHECAKRILKVGPLRVDDKLPVITAESGGDPPTDRDDPDVDELLKGVMDDSPSSASGLAAKTGNADSASLADSRQTDTAPNRGTDDAESNALNQAAKNANQQTANRPANRPAQPVNNMRRNARNRNWFPWAIGFGLLGTVGTFFGVRHWRRYRRRMCETCQIERVLLTEVQDDEFLEAPQVLEEKIGSVDYDVWACLECEDVIKIRHGRWFTRYSRCPECSYVTRFKIKKTVIPASTISGGLVRVDEHCKNCTYHHTYTYATPRIEVRKRRSSGGGFRSSGRSSGGGFGGGRSSGGGASGSW